MSDCTITRGYAVGVNVEDTSLEPSLVVAGQRHTIAYDIETQYLGPQASSFQSPILLCVCLNCSCGYTVMASRVPLSVTGSECVTVGGNSQAATVTIELIIKHSPLFNRAQYL
jgi:hypothetical protein